MSGIAFIHPERYFNFKLDQFISLLKQGQRCTNVEKWKIKSILSPKVHLARFYGIFKEVAYFCMRPIDNYLSALDGFLSSKGFLTKLKQCVAATHFLRLGGERWSEVKFLWENNAMTGPGL